MEAQVNGLLLQNVEPDGRVRGGQCPPSARETARNSVGKDNLNPWCIESLEV